MTYFLKIKAQLLSLRIPLREPLRQYESILLLKTLYIITMPRDFYQLYVKKTEKTVVLTN